MLSYSLRVQPAQHFVNWQQDPYGNHLARFVFPGKAKELNLEVDLVAEMTVINPFDFFLDQEASSFPFTYSEPTATELAPYLITQPVGPRIAGIYGRGAEIGRADRRFAG